MRRTIPLNQATKWKLRGDSQTVLGKSALSVRMLKLNDEKHLKVYGGCFLTISDDTVSPSHRIRNMGVHMDQHLTTTDHVTAVCAACNYHLYRLSSIWHYLTTEAAKSAVNALVTSRLDNCNALLHNIPLSQRARLQRVQNNAARLITRTTSHQCRRSCIGCQLRAESPSRYW